MTLVLYGAVAVAITSTAFTTQGVFAGVLTLLGFAVGLLVGFELQEVPRLIRAEQGEPDMIKTAPPKTTRRVRVAGGFRHLPGRAMSGVRRLATSPWGLTLSVVALCQAIIAALLIYVLLDYKSYQECLAAWQTASSSSQVARAIVAEETDAAMDDVVFAVGESDRQAFRAAVQRYIEVRKNQQEERLKNPIPPSPTEVCGGAG